MVKSLQLKKRTFLSAAFGTLVGVVLILGIRFFAYAPAHTHYHANFAVYINGQREQFKDPMLYEESGASCSEERVMTPQERAHMHDNVNDVVHVEDHAVTWGQFFINLGWVVDAKVIETPSQTYLADADHKITFILNGEATDNVSNRVIGDTDRLLVDYGGGSDQVIKQEYSGVAATAHKYDIGRDPKSCGSQAAPSFHDRFTHLF